MLHILYIVAAFAVYRYSDTIIMPLPFRVQHANTPPLLNRSPVSWFLTASSFSWSTKSPYNNTRTTPQPPQPTLMTIARPAIISRRAPYTFPRCVAIYYKTTTIVYMPWRVMALPSSVTRRVFCCWCGRSSFGTAKLFSKFLKRLFRVSRTKQRFVYCTYNVHFRCLSDPF